MPRDPTRPAARNCPKPFRLEARLILANSRPAISCACSGRLGWYRNPGYLAVRYVGVRATASRNMACLLEPFPEPSQGSLSPPYRTKHVRYRRAAEKQVL